MSRLSDSFKNNDFSLPAIADELGIQIKGRSKAARDAKKALCQSLEADEDFKAAVEEKVIELRDAGALFVVNHSAGKDSQALYLVIRDMVPQEQIVVIHAQLPEVDWEGLEEHILNTIDPGTEFRTCVACDKSGETKTFFQMVERSWERLQANGKADKASPWPGPAMRQCTSDLKTGPIEKVVRHYLKEHPEFNGLVVDCMGVRSGESCNRTNAIRFAKHTDQSIAGRNWYRWFPLKDWRCSTDHTFDPSIHKDDVFDSIADAGQKPHWAYGMGMTRLSCCFCIMSSAGDVRCAARLKPELFERIINTEKAMGKTFMMPGSKGPQYLDEYAGITVEEARAAKALVIPEDLNPKEKRVLAELAERQDAVTLAELAEACFPSYWSEDEVRAKRQVSNSVRRLVARELVSQVGRGTYLAA
jgi:3'-phosphoadenosine 5'-phosphosulfate sulfotransferase (PAPS reductase)/FAD synthetase